jgi:autotransporter-associated beta strand protein
MQLSALSLKHRMVRGCFRVAICFVVALLICAELPAAEETWIGTSGNWSEDSKWLDGTAPPAGGDPDLTLQFTRGVATTNDLGAFQLNRLRFEPFLTGTLTVASGAGSSLVFGGQRPVIEALNISDSILSSPITLNPASGDTLITGNRSGTLTVSGAISETGTPRKLEVESSTPSLSAGIVALTGANSFTGGMVLRAGNLSLENTSAAGTGPLEIFGGTLRLNLTSLSNPIVLHDDLVIASANAAILSGPISEATPGAGLSLRNRTSTLSLTAPATYTGPTLIDYAIVPADSTGAGSLSLSGNGTILNSSSIEVRAGGRFSSTSSGGTTNRIDDGTPVNLRSGTFTFSGNAAPETHTETIGALSGGGWSTITVIANPSGGNTRLAAASLSRSDRGTFLVRGTNFGAAFGSGTGNLLLATSPGGLAGAGGAGPGSSILPYMIGATSSGGTGDTFVTWDGCEPGFRNGGSESV